jgi:hypothetical protein
VRQARARTTKARVVEEDCRARDIPGSVGRSAPEPER